MENHRGAGFEIRRSVLWLVSDGVGEEDVDVLLANVRARARREKVAFSFAKEKVWNFIRIVISLKSSLLGGWAIELVLVVVGDRTGVVSWKYFLEDRGPVARSDNRNS